MDKPIEEYSKPIKTEETNLAIIYWLDSRTSKKGRSLTPVYDENFLLKFKTKYSYVVRFLEKNNTAGNHYHKIKQEIMIPLEGEFEMRLEDIETGEKEIFQIRAAENKAFYVKTGVAHSVTSKKETGILLVLASSSSNLKDEIEYQIGD